MSGFLPGAEGTKPMAGIELPEQASGPWPGFGTGTVAVGSSNSDGASAFAARVDHVHRLDIVAYPPSNVGMQAGGVIQQTYTAPTATPAVLTMLPGVIPFGHATNGTLTQQATVTSNGLVWDTTNARLQIIRGGAGGIATALLLHNNNATGTGSRILMQANGVSVGALQMSTTLHSMGPNGGTATVLQFAGSTRNTIVGFYADGDAVIGTGNLDLPTTTTTGFPWLARISGAPTGVPANSANANLLFARAVILDETNNRFYSYLNSAWKFTTFDNYSATATRIPFGGSTAGTLTDSANLTYTSGTGILQSPVVNSNTVSGFGGGGAMALYNNVSDDAHLFLGPGALLEAKGDLFPSADQMYNLGTSAKSWQNLWINSLSLTGANATIDFAADTLQLQTNTTATMTLAHQGQNRITINSVGMAFFGNTPVAQQTGGAATAGGTYTATEQGMLQRVYDACRTLGLMN